MRPIWSKCLVREENRDYWTRGGKSILLDTGLTLVFSTELDVGSSLVWIERIGQSLRSSVVSGFFMIRGKYILSTCIHQPWIQFNPRSQGLLKQTELEISEVGDEWEESGTNGRVRSKWKNWFFPEREGKDPLGLQLMNLSKCYHFHFWNSFIWDGTQLQCRLKAKATFELNWIVL